MPALKKSEYEQKNVLFRANVKRALELSGVKTMKHLSERMQFHSTRTLNRRLADPDTLTVGELRRLKTVLRMDEVTELL